MPDFSYRRETGGSVAPCGHPKPSITLAVAIAMAALHACPTQAPAAAGHASKDVSAIDQLGPMYIREYRVKGAKSLKTLEVERAVYPYLGPGRSEADVEEARASLEQAYRDHGYQTVSVRVPQQQVRRGIVVLEVVEAPVGRLRVKGSRYFLPSEIKKRAQSMAEGSVINFNDVERDVLALNQWPDRRVTPELKPGLEPDTVDIDLKVTDTLPLHGSLELNNRYSADTTELRLNGSLSYGNLWQLGHTLGGSFQVSPLDVSEVKVFAGYYVARLPSIDWLSVLVQGVKQESNVSTLSALAVAGNGGVIGARAIFTLPGMERFFHSLSAGLDYKHFSQELDSGTEISNTPITYYPVSAAYNATWIGDSSFTDFSTALVFNLRGLGSDPAEFDANRFRADGSFIYLRGDLSHTHDLPWDIQAFGRIQGQVANQPLVSSEQFGLGGLNTVRGYLEAEVLADNAIAGTLELRSPSLLSGLKGKGNEWRFYLFTDAAAGMIYDALPGQESSFQLASFGIGSSVELADHFNGSVDAAVPLTTQTETHAHEVRVNFRLWADF